MEACEPKVTLDDPQLLIHTSGTTGSPKGTVIMHVHCMPALRTGTTVTLRGMACLIKAFEIACVLLGFLTEPLDITSGCSSDC